MDKGSSVWIGRSQSFLLATWIFTSSKYQESYRRAEQSLRLSSRQGDLVEVRTFTSCNVLKFPANFPQAQVETLLTWDSWGLGTGNNEPVHEGLLLWRMAKTLVHLYEQEICLLCDVTEECVLLQDNTPFHDWYRPGSSKEDERKQHPMILALIATCI